MIQNPLQTAAVVQMAVRNNDIIHFIGPFHRIKRLLKRGADDFACSWKPLAVCKFRAIVDHSHIKIKQRADFGQRLCDMSAAADHKLLMR